MNKEGLRKYLKKKLDSSVNELNKKLSGEGLDELRPILERNGRAGNIPHWYEGLKNGNLPNSDGKTVGSIIEMLYVAVLENFYYKDKFGIELRVNPARGVDIPALDLGIKSPSTNFCTSEPFYSAYERILGNEHDTLILLTDYQETKTGTGKIKIIDKKYLQGSELADKSICDVAHCIRADYQRMQNPSDTKTLVRFISYVNQSDWLGKELLKAVKYIGCDKEIKESVEKSIAKYHGDNKSKFSRHLEPVSCEYLEILEKILKTNTPRDLLVKETNAWVINNLGESAQIPNDNEWVRFQNSPLNGKIGMSFALQWRYNFSKIFKNNKQITASA